MICCENVVDITSIYTLWIGLSNNNLNLLIGVS